MVLSVGETPTRGCAERRVLLFGLSADPPTGDEGHLGILRWAVTRESHPELGGPVDAIWVLPVYRHVFDEKSGLAPFEDRVQMCRLAFENRGLPVEVKTLERTLAEAHPGRRTGTMDLVEHCRRLEPNTLFGLLLGADTARDLVHGRWRRGDELLSDVAIVVVPRVGVEVSNRDLAPLTLAEDAPAPLAGSSTGARTRIRDRERFLDPLVAAYVRENGLYGGGRERI